MPRHLPVIIDPTEEPRFASLREREHELQREVGRMSIADLMKYPLLSANSKTSVSLDFPIGHTCTPTSQCASVCYASRPGTPARWDKSLKMRLRTLRYFELETPRLAADRLWREFSKLRRRWIDRVDLDFLRVNGTGDLVPAVVHALNIFIDAHPEITVWVVTRKPLEAGMLTPRRNLYLQLSTDSTTSAGSRALMQVVLNENPQAYLSFLRVKPDDDAKGAAIVFNEKGTPDLPYDSIAACPVDAGRLELGNVRGVGGTACSKCRKCFVPRTPQRQRMAQIVAVE